MKTPKVIRRQPNRSSRPFQPKLFSVNQSCDLLGIGRTNFYSLVAAQKLSVVKLGRRTLVPAEVIDAFLASLSDTSANSSGGS
jgi:excisionase family DNA binding protein